MLEIPEKEISAVDLLKRADFAESNAAAKRLIAGRAVKIDGQTLEDIGLLLKEDVVLRCGKSRFVQIHFTGS